MLLGSLDGLLGTAPGAKPIGRIGEVRFENQHQLLMHRLCISPVSRHQVDQLDQLDGYDILDDNFRATLRRNRSPSLKRNHWPLSTDSIAQPILSLNDSYLEAFRLNIRLTQKNSQHQYKQNH